MDSLTDKDLFTGLVMCPLLAFVVDVPFPARDEAEASSILVDNARYRATEAGHVFEVERCTVSVQRLEGFFQLS